MYTLIPIYKLILYVSSGRPPSSLKLILVSSTWPSIQWQPKLASVRTIPSNIISNTLMTWHDVMHTYNTMHTAHIHTYIHAYIYKYSSDLGGLCMYTHAHMPWGVSTSCLQHCHALTIIYLHRRYSLVWILIISNQIAVYYTYSNGNLRLIVTSRIRICYGKGRMHSACTHTLVARRFAKAKYIWHIYPSPHLIAPAGNHWTCILLYVWPCKERAMWYTCVY